MRVLDYTMLPAAGRAAPKHRNDRSAVSLLTDRHFWPAAYEQRVMQLMKSDHCVK